MGIFRGINFPFQRSTTALPAPVEDDELVKQSIIQLILTARGERVMRPYAGSNIHRYLFDNNDDVLAETIRGEIASTIGKFEPRAQLQDVQVKNLRDSGAVQVDVFYVVKATRRQDAVSMEIPTV